MPATVFDLVRHSHAPWAPTETRALSEAGKRSAAKVARLLCRRSDSQDMPVTAIYSSPSLRAQQTVAPLAEQLGLPIRTEIGLRERNLGGIFPDAEAFRTAVRTTWQDPTFCLPGGETNLTAQSRGVAVLDRLRRDHLGERIVVGTHGNLLALILQHFDAEIGFEFWAALTMPDIYRLHWPDSGRAEITRLWSSADGSV